jgi:FkbM family methyltransferase
MERKRSFWTEVKVLLVRALVPRWLRNSLRRPRITARRLKAKAEFYAGHVAHVEMRKGWELRCHPICKESFLVFGQDHAQLAELDQFVRYCTEPMRLLDVGSHWGVFTLAALKYGGNKSQILCVEPSPSAIKILNINVQLNAPLAVVTVAEAAAGAQDGSVQMLTTGAGGDDYLVVPFASRRDTVAIRQVTLNNVCAEHRFRPSHVKIDVEGFEEDALKGSLSILRECRPIIFLELHGDLIRRRGAEATSVLALLRGAGYRRWEQFGKSVSEDQLALSGYNARLVCFPEG